MVGFPHEIKGEGIYAYVVLKTSSAHDKQDLVKEMQKLVRDKIAAYAVPEHIQVNLAKMLKIFHIVYLRVNFSFVVDYLKQGQEKYCVGFCGK